MSSEKCGNGAHCLSLKSDDHPNAHKPPVARSDFIIVKAGIQGTKYALDHYVEKGLGGVARLPLGELTEATKKLVENDLKEDWEFESKL